MTQKELLDLITDLRQNINPLTKEPCGGASCLTEAAIRRSLSALMAELAPETTAAISRKEVVGLVADLRALDYRPTVTQMSKVLTGSRSIADPRLRGLPAYRRYRGILTQRAIVEMLKAMDGILAQPTTEESDPEAISPPVDDWQAVDFFTEGPFDKLEEPKAQELAREVRELGLRKSSDRLPAYMARARQRLPRAFEPWTRDERALLIEAMCYTNDLGKLRMLFGRSVASLEREGKRLIWESRRHNAA